MAGIIPPLNGTEIPLGTPVKVALIVVQFIMYFLFIKILDKQALKEEAQLKFEEAHAK